MSPTVGSTPGSRETKSLDVAMSMRLAVIGAPSTVMRTFMVTSDAVVARGAGLAVRVAVSAGEAGSATTGDWAQADAVAARTSTETSHLGRRFARSDLRLLSLVMSATIKATWRASRKSWLLGVPGVTPSGRVTTRTVTS